ncbi:MAG: hypothetical protein NT018_13745 [Armatimonadetes bacterium]|nr:hypothetical protein [Armatimonadota bacterium]
MLNCKHVDSINNRARFVAFVRELAANFVADPQSWDNCNISLFLNALAAFVEDMDGYYVNQGLPIPEEPDWNVIANVLMAARVYE